MLKIILGILFFIVLVFSMFLSFTIVYHFRRFKIPIDIDKPKILSYLFPGVFILLLFIFVLLNLI